MLLFCAFPSQNGTKMNTRRLWLNMTAAIGLCCLAGISGAALTPAMTASAQIEATAAPTAVMTNAAATVSATVTDSPGSAGLSYVEDFKNPGVISFTEGGTKYPQWGTAIVANGALCDTLPAGNIFDTIPLPVYAASFYAELQITAYDDNNISVGVAMGDFTAQKYAIYFLMNDFRNKWQSSLWYYGAKPGLQQQSSHFYDTPLWTTGAPFRFAIEARDGTYFVYAENNGQMRLIDQTAFAPVGSQLALAMWGSDKQPRKMCFNSITVRAAR